MNLGFPVDKANILIIGGGIGGLTAAIALRQQGFDVELIEREPEWNVYGIGIIQQSSVVREMAKLGLLDRYLDAGFGFDFFEIYLENGQRAARLPSAKLADGYPANVGVGRRALHEVLSGSAIEAGARIRLGTTASAIDDDDLGMTVTFSDGSQGRYDAAVGADGIYSTTRTMIFPEAVKPEFVGQGGWRYNFTRSPDLDCIRSYAGPIGIGLVPIAHDSMYMFATTPEPDNPHFPRRGIAAVMRDRLKEAPAAIQQLLTQLNDDEAVVYKPFEIILLTGAWHRGRTVLLGDAVHATTPHLAQGAGMAIEDGVVLAEELAAAATVEEAFVAYRDRRFERCKYIVEASRAMCDGQLGKRPLIDPTVAVRKMFEVTSQPI